MGDVFVGSLMSSPVHTISGDATLREAAAVLLEHGIGSVIVVDDDGGLDGILTATDFVGIVAGERHGDAPSTTVAEAMSTDVVTATANEAIETAADLMVESGHNHLPIIDAENVVIGVLAAHDLTAYISTVRAPSPPRREDA